MTLDIEFKVPTWDQIYEMLLGLAAKIRKDKFRPDVIVGICRGGWTPARVMSDLLGNPKMANVTVEFYLGVAESKNEPVITQPVSVSVNGKKVLILDDVADTGKSLRLVKEHLSEQGAVATKIATIYLKPWSIVVPDYYERETSCWVVFPWERKETIRNLVKRFKKEDVIERLVKGGMDRALADRFINKAIIEGSD